MPTISSRCSGFLRIFNTDYERIDIDNIHNVRTTKSEGISFEDGHNEYRFNVSKSVLSKYFYTSHCHKDIPITIIENPLDYLMSLIPNRDNSVSRQSDLPIVPSISSEYVILPLYSSRGKHKEVPQKSGLNQWNASGRTRDDNEVYIPIPVDIRRKYPNFFPDRDTAFILELPDGDHLQAKVCQDDGKALMSNPNSALGEWILRKVLKKRAGELVTMSDLLRIGIDSVVVTKKRDADADCMAIYNISFYDTPESYDTFVHK